MRTNEQMSETVPSDAAASSAAPSTGARTSPPVPTDVRPILAVIETTGDLGPQMWREVVHYDTDSGEWHPFAGSDTFRDGETVTRWIYADEALP